ncbi:ThiF family adenylyltransferase [Ralstonia pseudosolanacearum]|uniref:ThiF family adenylyltransferase n=1 Tax=Ralstonia pseudosolanacearum TaxID=1310165 RepID=UPI000491DAFE|nr:ThiF family adenylyltransferase [Ralstonia pseudosolanacearum]MDO3578557.1 ThiF family adenylyltransferase [Ralstonia pseudosolanacearum]MDO3587857.1 ThiF family adenylyltransferase [Ralstonia pseudosolanacearum]
MSQKLVSHNEDLQRLIEKGYAVAFDGPHLIVRDIPYLDAAGSLHWAAFVAKLVFVDEVHVVQEDHQVYFSGGVPHNMDGTPVQNLAGGPHTLTLSKNSEDVVVQRSFSNKPRSTDKFENFFDKIESYVALIAGPAMSRHDVTPYTFRIVETEQEPSVFKFQDTLTSRAEITELSRKFAEEVVAIIGLGGTGSFVLDYIVKTPVKEVRAFDLDPFHVHNAFRSPGRLIDSELGKSKTEVYADRYDNFRHGLVLRPKMLDSTSASDLQGVTFAFVCVDKGSARAEVFPMLIEKGIRFIDVGMGPSLSKQGPIKGMLRTTYFPPGKAEDVLASSHVEMQDAPEDVYRSNIQIAELNALNAAIAVIRFKQLCGFYVGDVEENNFLFDIRDMKIASNGKA